MWWGWQKRRNRADEGKEGKGGDEKSAEAGFRGLEKRGGGVGTWSRTEMTQERERRWGVQKRLKRLGERREGWMEGEG